MMICEDDLILVERAMKNSKTNIGYVLKCKNGKSYISNISEKDVFENAIYELDFEYILIATKNNYIINDIDIEYISKKVNKNFKIYFICNNKIEEYKL